MFMVEAPGICSDSPDDEWKEGSKTFDILSDTVEACMQEGYFKGYTKSSLSFIFWSMVHGMSSLHITGRCDKVFTKDNADSILLEGLETLAHFVDQIK
jgi:hypothetical protein